MIERRPRAPVLRSMARLAMARQRVVGECQLGILQLEQPLVLLDQRVLRLRQDGHERVLVEILVSVARTGQATDEFRDQAEFQQVLGFEIGKDLSPTPRASFVAHTSAPNPMADPLPRAGR